MAAVKANESIFKVASSLFQPSTRHAMDFGLRKAVQSMNMGAVGSSAAIGAGAMVARNVMQGRDLTDNIGQGAVMGVAGRMAWRTGWQGKQYMDRIAKLRGTKGSALGLAAEARAAYNYSRTPFKSFF